MNTNVLRISEKNKLTNDIKFIENQLELNNNTITRFLNGVINDFTQKKIVLLREKNGENEKKIILTRERLDQLNRGELDEELTNELILNKKDVDLKSDVKKTKKKLSKEIDVNNKEILQKHYNSENKIKRENKWSEKDMQRTYDIFLKKMASIPPYIEDNLKKMPANKGYIWQDIYCYGHLPREVNRPFVMFENKKGVAYVHECDDYETRLYKKDERNKAHKILISRAPRKKLM